MSYSRNQAMTGIGEADPCTDNPSDPVCEEFYKPPAAAPVVEPGGAFIGFGEMIKKGIAALTPGSPAAPKVAKAAISPVIMIAGVGAVGVAAWWLFLRKKK